MNIELPTGPYYYDPTVPQIGEFYLAYRKVKAELWRTKSVNCMADIAEYESRPEVLHQNLVDLREKLTSFQKNGDVIKAFGKNFLGEVYTIPKPLTRKKEEDPSIIDLSSATSNKNPDSFEAVSTRSMAHPSIDFQILGVLWAMNNGANKDAPRSTCSRANVLMRLEPEGLTDVESESEKDRELRHNSGKGKINKLCPSLYCSYIPAYQKWRSDGLTVAKEVLDSKKGVYVLTLDIKNFYPSIDAASLRNLTNRSATSQTEDAFFSALEAWQEEFGERSNDGDHKRGIPIGLIASGLIANLILDPLDKSIEACVEPLHYGRYVDDIFLVVSDQAKIKDVNSLLRKLSKQLVGLQDEHNADNPASLNINESGGAKFACPLWGNSNFEINRKKTKCFHLEGERGKDFLRVVDESLKENASEWRMVPDLGDDHSVILKEALCSTSEPETSFATLRNSDTLSIRRLGFVLNLRKLEELEQYHLANNDWKLHRNTFYRFSIEHIFTPTGISEYIYDIPRIFGLAFANSDWDSALKMLKKLSQSLKQLSRLFTSKLDVNQFLYKSLIEQFISSCKLAPKSKISDRVIYEIKILFPSPDFKELANSQSIQRFIDIYQRIDLGRNAASKALLNSSNSDNIIEEADEFLTECQSLSLYLPEGAVTAAPSVSASTYLFPTRLLGPLDLSFAESARGLNPQRIKKYMKVCRGVCYPDEHEGIKKNDNVVSIRSHVNQSDEVRVAVTNFRTEDSSFNASVRNKPDCSLKRLQSLLSLVDQFLRQSQHDGWNERALYFVLPELSVPTAWLLPLAKVFRTARVSLIVGGEYEHKKGTQEVINPAYLFLTCNEFGYPDMIAMRHTKSEAAHGEAELLWGCNHTFIAERETGQICSEAKVYNHGGFYFGVALCSELSNAELHHHYRAKVDAVFIPQWNQDVGTFGSLIEASAYSVHAYMIQVNNRKYGDSRIRVPAKERYEQDIVRLMGGEHDYYVVGNLDIESLREFQRDKHSKSKKFKPTPSGFDRTVGKERLGLNIE